MKWSPAQWMSEAAAWTRGSKQWGDGAENSLIHRNPKKASVKVDASMCQSPRPR